ncbi:hypothetical protein MKZ07_21675 [Paenibacillus sp. FSL P4-0338]|uniref:hypothetical protein n=1 Tax=Paenibacillus sp. FSL P4-0338 TaxID=2921635 RepID=UPI0030FA8EC7
MRQYFLLLTLLAVALNTVGIFYHKPMFNIIAIGMILILIPLDIYLEPTRRKVKSYCIGAVLLALLWAALHFEWITPLMFI